MNENITIGLIGAGRIGRVHARNLSGAVAGVRLAAVADPQGDAAASLAREFGVPRAFEHHRALLDDPDIDAVAICSSSQTHAPLIAEAARAGKHIFCEKPIALDLGRIDEALAAVAEAGVALQVGFNRRFDANFRRVREVVSGGRIGEPQILRITSRDPGPPPLDYIRVSGGMFLDMTIHDFDMARYVMGREIEEVYAAGAVLVDPAIGEAGDVDTALITLRFAGGAIGSIDNCRRAAYGYDQRVEVLGTRGMVETANDHADRATVSDADGVHGALPLHFFLERYQDAFVAEMQAFVDAVRTGGPVPVTGADGRAPLVLGLAALRSLREGRPVRTDEIG